MEDEELQRKMWNLHRDISVGNSTSAIAIVQEIDNVVLRADQFDGRCALLWLPFQAFQSPDTTRMENTKKLIEKYIDAGWNIHATTAGNLENPIGHLNVWWLSYYVSDWRNVIPPLILSNFNLLHLACMYEGHDIIKLLVDHGANPNTATGGMGMGNVRLSPLHLSIICQEYESALFLLDHGSEPHSRGYVDIPGFNFTRVIRPSFTDFSAFTPIEILLKAGTSSCGDLLDRLLHQDRENSTVAELHVGMEGARPLLVSKILRRLPQQITTEEMNWVTLSGEEGITRVPSFLLFVENYKETANDLDLHDPADLLEALVERGYDCNLSNGALIFKLLEKFKQDNILLRKLLKFDHVNLNVRNADRQTPVEVALLAYESGFGCVECYNQNQPGRYTKSDHYWKGEAVILLIERGADVSNWDFRPRVIYHKVHEKLLKLLHSKGAKIYLEDLKNRGRRRCKEHKNKISEALKELQDWIRERESQGLPSESR